MLKPFGPKFLYLNENKIQILEGSLQNRIFTITKNYEGANINLSLFLEENQIGAAYSEIKKRVAILYDIFIQREYRMTGLASLLVRTLFRDLLLTKAVESFNIRMAMKYTKGGSPGIVNSALGTETIENVGIGMIARKLGFEPDIDAQEIFSSTNVQGVEILPGKDIYPTGYKLTLGCPPWTLVVILLDKEKRRPLSNLEDYQRFLTPTDLLEELAQGRLLIGNVDYVLKSKNFPVFVEYIAEDETERNRFLKQLREV